MTIQLDFGIKGITVKTKIVNPITKNESPHDDFAPYNAVRRLDIKGISRIEPVQKENEFVLRFTAESISDDDARVSPLSLLRHGSRRWKIANHLIQNKGREFDTKDLKDALNEKDPDMANIQWEATLLVRQIPGFTTTKKGNRLAYLYTG